MHILENPYLWHLFRIMINMIFKSEKSIKGYLDGLCCGGGA
jgi:hypothetical protein